MNTNRLLFSSYEGHLARFVVAGFVLSLAPLSAQTAPTPSNATTPSQLQPPSANTSPYNTGAKTPGNQGGAALNPNEVNPSSASTTAGTGTGTPYSNVNAGGGSGSGQGAGSSTSNP